MMEDIETAVLRAARRVFGTCKNCGGFVQIGLDEFRKATGTCVACGRENIQNVMPAEAVEAMCGPQGGRRG